LGALIPHSGATPNSEPGTLLFLLWLKNQMWLKPGERDLTFITYPLAKAERQYQQPETSNQ